MRWRACHGALLGSRKLPSISQHTHICCINAFSLHYYKMCSYPLARQIIYFIVIWRFQIYVSRSLVAICYRFQLFFFRWGRNGNVANQIDVLVRQMTMICFYVPQNCWLLFVILGIAGISGISLNLRNLRTIDIRTDTITSV